LGEGPLRPGQITQGPGHVADQAIDIADQSQVIGCLCLFQQCADLIAEVRGALNVSPTFSNDETSTN
jgi:hypothetical protein